MKKRAIVAMSGGVDSSLSASLMKQEGYEVIGVTLIFFPGQEYILADAEKVAKDVGVEWHWLDRREEFKKIVIDYFVETYKQGKTPNPCAYCNRNAKFRYMMEELHKYDADVIVTGHYANVSEFNGRKYVTRGTDDGKDQSYYLSLLPAEVVQRLYFPLAMSKKVDVRVEAKNLGLHVHDKKDSMDACFLQGRDYREYLREVIPPSDVKGGNFIVDGKPLTPHNGITEYTTGQRKGLGVSYSEPLYVSSIDPKSGDVTLGRRADVLQKELVITDCSFNGELPADGRVLAQHRHRMKPAPGTLTQLSDTHWVFRFDNEQFAPTPGQVAAFYVENRVVGGGFIESVR